MPKPKPKPKRPSFSLPFLLPSHPTLIANRNPPAPVESTAKPSIGTFPFRRCVVAKYVPIATTTWTRTRSTPGTSSVSANPIATRSPPSIAGAGPTKTMRRGEWPVWSIVSTVPTTMTTTTTRPDPPEPSSNASDPSPPGSPPVPPPSPRKPIGTSPWRCDSATSNEPESPKSSRKSIRNRRSWRGSRARTIWRRVDAARWEEEGGVAAAGGVTVGG
mmetsp:Transcript_486/g.1140  ORF Transcript_486/g.1140 Transcript_486/m.1140 type:complete len:217 (-) Transcript_486:717-1367(-)